MVQPAHSDTCQPLGGMPQRGSAWQPCRARAMPLPCAAAMCSAALSHPRSLNRVLELLYHPLASPLSLPRSLASHASSRARPPLMPSASSCYCSRRLQLDRCCKRLAEPGAPARPRPSFVASRTSPRARATTQFVTAAACRRPYVAGPL